MIENSFGKTTSTPRRGLDATLGPDGQMVLVPSGVLYPPNAIRGRLHSPAGDEVLRDLGTTLRVIFGPPALTTTANCCPEYGIDDIVTTLNRGGLPHRPPGDDACHGSCCSRPPPQPSDPGQTLPIRPRRQADHRPHRFCRQCRRHPQSAAAPGSPTSPMQRRSADAPAPSFPAGRPGS